MSTPFPTGGVTFAQAAELLAAHLAGYRLPQPASVTVLIRRAERSEVEVQLLSCRTVAEVAGELLIWADTLTTLTVQAWWTPKGDQVHLSIASTLTGPADAVETPRLRRHGTRPGPVHRSHTRRTPECVRGTAARMGGQCLERRGRRCAGMTTPTETVTELPSGRTRAERMRQPLAADVVAAVADQHGVCIRPFTMEVGDPDTGELRYVPMPCGSTVASVCGPCARKARALRMVQCREGWHLTEEPTFNTDQPTIEQRAALTERADLVAHYRDALHNGRPGDAEELREAIREADDGLRQLGVRGTLPSPDLPGKRPPKRSTKRRQEAPNLPTRKVSKTTLGREFAGRFRPSMFVTLTCESYGRVREDGTPVDPDSYDYRRAARDAVHFASLVDRWWQNLRRVVGWDVQYFATVEPQKRGAPHLHTALRGSIPHEVIRQVTAATYHQVWWPNHDQLAYSSKRLPVWEPRSKAFIDPDSRQPLASWADALDQADEPAHVVTFGRQVHSKGILGGTDQAGRHLGYLTKYSVMLLMHTTGP